MESDPTKNKPEQIPHVHKQIPQARRKEPKQASRTLTNPHANVQARHRQSQRTTGNPSRHSARAPRRHRQCQKHARRSPKVREQGNTSKPPGGGSGMPKHPDPSSRHATAAVDLCPGDMGLQTMSQRQRSDGEQRGP